MRPLSLESTIIRHSMFTTLSIRDFAVIDQLELEFSPGLTVFTGETGAGKSILFDALQLALGERATSAAVRSGCDRAEVTAEFHLENNPAIQQWLVEQDLDDGQTLLLRRVVTSQGRSRAYVNGTLVPVQTMKELGQKLVEIHGQHEHQTLTRSREQMRLLDVYAGLQDDLAALQRQFEAWKSANAELEALRAQAALSPAELDLIRYQVEELQAAAVSAEQLQELHDEHRRLAHSGDLIQATDQAATILDQGDASACDQIARAAGEISSQVKLEPALAEPLELMESALIQAREAAAALARVRAGMDTDPQRLEALDQQLSELHQLARKHRVEAEDLAQKLESLRERLNRAEQADSVERDLSDAVARHEKDYRSLAAKISKKRQRAATRLAEDVTRRIRQLGMERGEFLVRIEHDPNHPPRVIGLDEVLFLVSANPGSPPAPVARVASGGELSRIALGLKVSLSEAEKPPSMIFDEVDAGVGGATAQTVGERLREVAQGSQVFCITHLPQVAACGHQHFQVSKEQDEQSTRTRVQQLPEMSRVEELARMLGGRKVTDQSLAHAREMLEAYH